MTVAGSLAISAPIAREKMPYAVHVPAMDISVCAPTPFTAHRTVLGLSAMFVRVCPVPVQDPAKRGRNWDSADAEGIAQTPAQIAAATTAREARRTGFITTLR